MLLLLVGWFHVLSAQNTAPDISAGNTLLPGDAAIGSTNAPLFIVRNIFITGNKKTKPDIILRELPFKPGDQYLLQEIVKRFEQARQQLMNTALFHDVIVALKSFEGYNVDILIEVKERWYIFPIPYFKPVDRNFNQWLVEQKASLNRVDYGVKLLYNNITGHNDKFRAWLLDGYSKQFSFEYDRLYFDKSLKWGMDMKFSVGKSKEINYNTIENKQVFLRDNNIYLWNFLNVNAEITYRRAIKTRHRFGVAYTRENVSDTVIALNPMYYSSGRKQVQFPELYYTMNYFDVDYIPYPTKGYAAELNFSKKGFNNVINTWELTLQGSANWHLLKRTYLNLRSYGIIKLPFKQPYFSQRVLGYSDIFMQGYEYYVIDGVAGGYLKAAITRELFNFRGNFLKKKREEPLHVPVRIFAKIYGNAGYIHNPQPGENPLTNQMLYSAGAGIDILTFYDFTIKLEWTFNQLGQNGVFLHRKSYF
ncbi:MAG: POTRA domain-containing protein [Chitinophagales bacterium]